MTLGDSLKKARLEKGLTQKQLGELCGMADSAIRRYENSTAKPKIATLRRITNALGLKLYDLGNILEFYSIDDLKEDLAPEKPNIKITWSSKMPESMGEHYKNLLVAAYDNLSDSGKSDAYKLLRAYSELNTTGQDEALKRTKELSKIEGNRKRDPNPDPVKPRFN